MKRAFVPLALLLLACGSPGRGMQIVDGDGGIIEPGADLTFVAVPTADEACLQIGAVLYPRLAGCFGYDLAWYQSYVQPERYCAPQVASVDAGRETYHPEALAACLDLYTNMACSDYYQGAPQKCQVFQPAVAAGGACHDYADCIDGYCQLTTDGCPSTCKAYTAKGAACATGDTCAPGSSCVGGTCVSPAYGAVGDACGTGQRPCDFFTSYCDPQSQRCLAKQTSGACKGYECAYGYQCAGPSATRTCQPAKHLGAACTVGNNECAAPEGSCSAQSLTCAVRGVGQSCGQIDGTTGEYAYCNGSASWCNVPTSQSVGTCDPFLADQAACPTGQGCDTFSLCIAGKCQAFACQ